jgi:hypothetical protein
LVVERALCEHETWVSFFHAIQKAGWAQESRQTSINFPPKVLGETLPGLGSKANPITQQITPFIDEMSVVTAIFPALILVVLITISIHTEPVWENSPIHSSRDFEHFELLELT